MLKLTTCLAILVLATSSVAQKTEISVSSLSLQYGYSLKARVEISRHPVLHISANGGVGSTFLAHQLYPTLNAEVQLYTGGMGTRKPNIKGQSLTFDFILAMTVTTGLSKNLFQQKNEAWIENRNMPLYYFSNFSFPSLVNPYDYSFSLGTNLVWSSDRGRFFQRLGFINFHVNRFQASYYNDGGPPIDFLGMGDKKDRYYTGGGIISYHGPKYTAINLVELGYHKFTGYSKNSFEVANHLQQAYVNYIDQTQKFFNRSLWSLNLANPQQHWGVNLREYNRTSWDMQHQIHWGGYNPFHLVAYDRTISVSGQAYYSQTNIGLR
ncbi:MAG: polymorphic toxin type 23 domain-containing protein [Chryseolinea sp.]